jgi:outer membrane protein
MRIITTISLLLFLASTAFADTIANRFGFTGRVGITAPLDNDMIEGTSDAKAGIAWNGGLIYGLNDYLAAELEFTRMPGMDIEVDGVKTYKARLNDVALGLQYRIVPNSPVVPYVGAGIDFIEGNLKYVNGGSHDLDWTFGGHVGAGVDWFLTRGIALSADVRGVMAISGDVKDGGAEVGDYDPFWFQGTLGVRLFLPEKW